MRISKFERKERKAMKAYRKYINNSESKPIEWWRFRMNYMYNN